ncbi:MAG: hypothetical protein RIQ72_290 [Candidatus Parcubacteria bacterium]
MYMILGFKKILYIGLAFILITLVLVISIYLWIQDNPSVRFGSDRSAVITQIQLLNRFETASYTIDKVIEANTGHTGIKEFLFGDKLILIAQGTVIAGFDMSKITPADFKGIGNEIHIKLPPAELFGVILNNNETKVFDRDTGVLTKGDTNLEAKARQEASETIRIAACEGGILSTATEQAKKQLELMLRTAGFEKVYIEVVPGVCK